MIRCRTRQERLTNQVYRNMIQRCYNPRCKSYKNYGAKGVTVDSSWLGDFYWFIRDMGWKPDGYSIERIDPTGNYEPSNCTWIPMKDQHKNKRPR